MNRRSVLASLTAGALTVSGCSGVTGRNGSPDTVGDIKLDGIRLRNRTESTVRTSLLLTRDSEIAYWRQHQLDQDKSKRIEPPDYEYKSGKYRIFVRNIDEGVESSTASTEFFEEGECYYLSVEHLSDGIRFSQSLNNENCRG